MRLVRLKVLFLVVSALGACGGGPQVIGGGASTVSIQAGSLANVSGYAERYCQSYGKRAVALGDIPLGPSTTKRLYAYDCVSPAKPHDSRRVFGRRTSGYRALEQGDWVTQEQRTPARVPNAREVVA
jgi:hypothetical protein